MVNYRYKMVDNRIEYYGHLTKENNKSTEKNVCSIKACKQYLFKKFIYNIFL